MRLQSLRLLVALLTFAAGVAASWLFGMMRAPAVGFEAAPVRCAAHSLADLPPPPAPPRVVLKLVPHDSVEGGILNDRAISKPEPAYPPAARAEGVQGAVTVRVVIDESGSVTTAQAVSGPRPLRQAAEDAALDARFPPTRLSGEPVKVSGVIIYNFVLE